MDHACSLSQYKVDVTQQDSKVLQVSYRSSFESCTSISDCNHCSGPNHVTLVGGCVCIGQRYLHIIPIAIYNIGQNICTRSIQVNVG